MPKNLAKTRKCYITRKNANATRNIASKRRKLFEDYITFYKNYQHKLLDVIHSLHAHVTSNKSLMATSMGKLMNTMMNPDNVSKLTQNTFPIQYQMMRFPPMSKKQEILMIQQAERSLKKGKDAVATSTKQLPKNVKMLTYTNPYPIKESVMPNLYVENAECAWEAGDNIDVLYKKRQAALEKVQTIINNELFLKEIKSNEKMVDMFESLIAFMEIMKTLPPGPNKESEQERIHFLQNQMAFFKNMMKLKKLLNKEIDILLKKSMKN